MRFMKMYLVAVFLLAVSNATQAAILVSTTPTYPTVPVLVGSHFPASIVLFNTSDGTNASHDIAVTGIFHTPSCAATPAPCTGANIDLGVFSVGNGTGSAFSACDSVVFTAGAPNSAGEIQFTPSAPFTLGPGDLSGGPFSCFIDFTVTVLKLPQDSTPPLAPITTNEFARATYQDVTTL